MDEPSTRKEQREAKRRMDDALRRARHAAETETQKAYRGRFKSRTKTSS